MLVSILWSWVDYPMVKRRILEIVKILVEYISLMIFQASHSTSNSIQPNMFKSIRKFAIFHVVLG